MPGIYDQLKGGALEYRLNKPRLGGLFLTKTVYSQLLGFINAERMRICYETDHYCAAGCAAYFPF